jgi:signal transduction histidine kinase
LLKFVQTKLFVRFFKLLFLFALPFAAVGQSTTLQERLHWFENHFQPKNEVTNDSLIQSLREQLVQAQNIHDKTAESFAAKALGLHLLTRIPDYEGALGMFVRSLQIEDSLQLREEQVITYLAMAKVFADVGDYHKSAELLEEAMERSRTFNNVHVLVFILNEQGRINALRGRTDEASENYNLLLSHKDELKSDEPEADAYANLSELYTLKGNFQEALRYHTMALKIYRKLRERRKEARSLSHIGDLYRVMKNHDKALANLVLALKIRTELKDEKGLAETYNMIGSLYHQNKNYSRAIANLELALSNAKAVQSTEEMAKSYDLLSQCYKETRNLDKALEARDGYAEMVDFMRLEKIEMELLEKQNRYVLEKKEVEIRHLGELQKERELKIQAQKEIQNALFLLIGFGVIIVLLVFYLYLVKRRTNKSLQAAHAKVNEQNKQLVALNATKDKFFSIISHDLKGPLNSFTAFSGMLINHTDNLTKEEIQMLAREIDKNLKNLLALLENLLEWSRSQTGNIEFKPQIFDLHDVIQQNQELLRTQARNKRIEIIYKGSEGARVTANKNSVNTVIRNLISNAIKFTPEGGRITISANQVGDYQRVSIRDTGVGMSAETMEKLFRIDTKYSTSGTANEKGTGLGLILCKDFIEKNKGTIGVESRIGEGSEFFFTLPASTAPMKVGSKPEKLKNLAI